LIYDFCGVIDRTFAFTIDEQFRGKSSDFEDEAIAKWMEITSNIPGSTRKHILRFVKSDLFRSLPNSQQEIEDRYYETRDNVS